MRISHTHLSLHGKVLLSLTTLTTLGVLALAGAAPAGATQSTQEHYGVKSLHNTAAGTASGNTASGNSASGNTATAHSARSSFTLSLRKNLANGSVSPTPKVYLVFWGKQWTTSDPAGVAADMQGFFKGLYGARDTWGTILDQYCEGLKAGTTSCGTAGVHVQHPASSPLAGVWFDSAANEPANPTAANIATEATSAAGHFGNKTQAPNDDAQYVIVSATGTHPDGFPNSGFCGWHDFTSTSYGNLAYTNLPYVPDLGAGACTTLTDGRLLSGIESTETHEYAETVTDFWPVDGWYNTANGEIGDECVNLDAYLTLSTGTYDVQGLWSNAANKCVTQG